MSETARAFGMDQESAAAPLGQRQEPELPASESGPPDVEWMGEVLNMVLERLQAYLGTDAIAPMFYDDAITAIAHRAAFGKLPEEMYPDGSLLHRLRAAEKGLAKLMERRDVWKRRAHRFRSELRNKERAT